MEKASDGLGPIMASVACEMAGKGDEIVNAELISRKCQHMFVTKKRRWKCGRETLLYEKFCGDHIKKHGGVTSEFNKH